MNGVVEMLVKHYKDNADSLTERQKAEIEQKIWALVADRSIVRRDYLKDLLGAGPHDTDLRSTLIRVGTAADLLWLRVLNKEMPLKTASMKLREAKETSRTTKLTLVEAVRRVVDEYDQLPLVRRMPGGVQLRIGTQSDVVQRRMEKQVFDKKPKPAAEEGDRAFWKWFRDSIYPFVSTKLKRVEPILAEKLYREFEVEFKTMLDDLQSRISRTLHEHKRGANILFKQATRESVRAACLVLSIDPPSFGRAADLKKATIQKRKLVKLYHPDLHGGDTGFRAKYQEVLEAYDTLDDYNRSLIPSGEEKHGGNHNGG